MKSSGIAAFCAAAVAIATLGAAPVSAASLQNEGVQFQNAQFSFGMGGGNRDRLERRGNSYFYNGHRGQREHRSGWRQYNGFWFPPSAFSFSIIIGNDGARVRFSARHVAWCDDHYRSYRRSDNSFKPFNGPRRQCRSPWY
jgi:hypothetical protein